MKKEMSSLEALFDDVMNPLHNAKTMITVILEADILERTDPLKVTKLLGIVEDLLNDAYVRSDRLWNAIEASYQPKKGSE